MLEITRPSLYPFLFLSTSLSPKRHGRRSYGRAFLLLTASTGEYGPTHKDLSYPVLPLCDLVALGVLADYSVFRPPTSTLEAGTLLHQLVPLRVPAIEIGPPLSAPPGLHLAGLVNAANIHATHCLSVGDDTNAGIDELQMFNGTFGHASNAMLRAFSECQRSECQIIVQYDRSCGLCCTCGLNS